VRIYLNTGSAVDPFFEDFFYAQADGDTLTEVGGGCMGLFPRVVYWDADAMKDLLVGRSDGKIKLYTNVGTDTNPEFDAGVLLEVGEPGSKVAIDVGSRACPIAVDWNADLRKDLVIGSLGGKIHLFLNEGLGSEPDFRAQIFAQADSADLQVPSSRSSPEVLDLDHDGRQDLITGNTNGELLFYSNVGTDDAPRFSGYAFVLSDDVPIDLPGTPRSRPSVCDWTRDGRQDVVIGASDGLVHIFQGVDHNHWAGVPEDEIADRGPRLLAAYPNPFRPSTSVPLVLEEGGRVRVTVHDPAGRRVAVLADCYFAPGPHELTWRGIDDAGRRVPSGIYFVRMVSGATTAARKLVLLR